MASKYVPLRSEFDVDSVDVSDDVDQSSTLTIADCGTKRSPTCFAATRRRRMAACGGGAFAILLLVVVGVVAHTHTSATTWTAARLPVAVLPRAYDLRVVPDLTTWTFVGDINITLDVVAAAEMIVLHAVGLHISAVTLTHTTHPSTVTALPLHVLSTNAPLDYLIVHTRVEAGHQYQLRFRFNGTIAEGFAGFYRSNTGDPPLSLATTQFEATDARRAFPCFDEPAFKAVFTITLFKPAGYVALSNMNVSSQNSPAVHDSGFVAFSPTPVMSSYLVAFILCPFEALRGITAAGVPVRAWAQPARVQQTAFALDVAIRALDFYNSFFQINFSLPKMDLIAIPDFAAGAMENWGCITFREEDMLIAPGSSNTADRVYVAMVVVHELGHQWFGNLVTMAWWSDLWLNEGFATYLESATTAALFPEWSMWTQFIVTAQLDAKRRDASWTTHALSVLPQDIVTKDQINAQFDAISYSKGGSILRMLTVVITSPVFEQGLHDYLAAHAFHSAATQDLWTALQPVVPPGSLPLSVAATMASWTTQPGFPLVTITRTGPATLLVTQERFSLMPMLTSQVWVIPMWFQCAFCASPVIWVTTARTTVELDECFSASLWVMGNVNGTAFVRVTYPLDAWALLARQGVLSRLAPVARAVLLSDAFALSESLRVPVSVPFDAAMQQIFGANDNTAYAVWLAWTTGLAPITSRFQHNATLLAMLRPFLHDVYAAVYDISVQVNGPITGFMQELVTAAACRAELSACEIDAEARFLAFLQNGTKLYPELQLATFETAVRRGGTLEWDAVFAHSQSTPSFREKIRCYQALGQAANISLLNRYLSWALDPTKIQVQDAEYVFSAVAANPVGRSLVFHFVQDNWVQLYTDDYFSYTLGDVIQAIAASVSRPGDIADMMAFFASHTHDAIATAVAVALETATNNARWMAQELPALLNWLQNFSSSQRRVG